MSNPYSIYRKAQELDERSRKRLAKAQRRTEERVGAVHAAAGEFEAAVEGPVATALSRYEAVADSTGRPRTGQPANRAAGKLYGVETVELEELAGILRAASVGGLGGLGVGAAGAHAAWWAVGTWGVASTGTPTATLSGVAAYNSTLAALGLGSLSAGGLGMAGGTLALGSIVALPVGVLSYVLLSRKANAALQQAQANARRVNAHTRKLAEARRDLEAIQRRITEADHVCVQLSAALLEVVTRLEASEPRSKRITAKVKRDLALADRLVRLILSVVSVTPAYAHDGESGREAVSAAQSLLESR